MTAPRLILASRSPRRRELMAQYGYTFEVLPASDSAECGLCDQEAPPQMVARLAYQKALDVAERGEEGILIGCDTICSCQGRILGKPADEDHARKMLELLRGKEHDVFSGLCIWPRPDGMPLVEVDRTRLKMAPLSDQEIADYLATGLWEGKAGGFGWQDRLGWLEVLDGSETNVVGLPMELLARMLDDVGYPVPPQG